MSNQNNSSSGISVVGLLGVAFVVLKLTKVIDWSWWYVTLPFWGGVVLALAIFTPFIIYKYRKSINKRKKFVNDNPELVESLKALDRDKSKSRFQQRIEDMQKKQAELRKK